MRGVEVRDLGIVLVAAKSPRELVQPLRVGRRSREERKDPDDLRAPVNRSADSRTEKKGNIAQFEPKRIQRYQGRNRARTT